MTPMIGVYAIALACLVYLLVRNELVHRENMRVLDILAARARSDLYAGRPYEHWLKAYRSVSYPAMVFSFRPIRSFHADLVRDARTPQR